jgi:hypothetical protein
MLDGMSTCGIEILFLLSCLGGTYMYESAAHICRSDRPTTYIVHTNQSESNDEFLT